MIYLKFLTKLLNYVQVALKYTCIFPGMALNEQFLTYTLFKLYLQISYWTRNSRPFSQSDTTCFSVYQFVWLWTLDLKPKARYGSGSFQCKQSICLYFTKDFQVRSELKLCLHPWLGVNCRREKVGSVLEIVWNNTHIIWTVWNWTK